MPIPTLEQEFKALSTEDVVTDKPTPLATSFVTPKKQRDANSSILSDDDTCISETYPVAPSPMTPDTVASITKTEHKLQEERGELAPEPLLSENPHRFVIFPIKDNEVSSFEQGFNFLNFSLLCISLLLCIVEMHEFFSVE